MVQVREVVKVFDGKEVLRHLNMSVERGTIYGCLLYTSDAADD